MTRLLTYFLLFFLSPLIGLSQFPKFLDNSIEQKPTLLNNSIDKLRVAGVAGISMISDGLEAEYRIIHNENSTKVVYVSVYYMPVYCELDTCDPYELIDSIKVLEDIHEDHYFTNGLLTSSIYYSQYIDSTEVDTSSIVQYFYEDRAIIKTTQRFFWRATLTKEKLYFWTSERLDSIHEFSNAIQSIFGTTYTDTLKLDRKLRYTYDDFGRLINKERYMRLFSKEIVTYGYPSSSIVTITQTPYHPISGCIMDNSISFSAMVIIEYRVDGLVKKTENYCRSKNEGEQWNDGEPIIYNLKYD